MRRPSLLATASMLAFACGGMERPPGEDGVPNLSYCESAAEWEANWSDEEWDLLATLNARRGRGADCGSAGSLSEAAPLSMHPALRCAARIHARDMSERQYFDHESPDGERARDWMAGAGYQAGAAGENLAWGQTEAEGVLTEWLSRDESCGRVMGGEFVHAGVGYFPDRGPYWTVVFAAPN